MAAWAASARSATEPGDTRRRDLLSALPLYGATVDLSEGRYLGVELQFVRDDEVAVESERHRGWVGIPAARVDCYASTQVVLLAADGSVRSRYVTTAEGC